MEGNYIETVDDLCKFCLILMFFDSLIFEILEGFFLKLLEIQKCFSEVSDNFLCFFDTATYIKTFKDTDAPETPTFIELTNCNGTEDNEEYNEMRSNLTEFISKTFNFEQLTPSEEQNFLPVPVETFSKTPVKEVHLQQEQIQKVIVLPNVPQVFKYVNLFTEESSCMLTPSRSMSPSEAIYYTDEVSYTDEISYSAGVSYTQEDLNQMEIVCDSGYIEFESEQAIVVDENPSLYGMLNTAASVSSDSGNETSVNDFEKVNTANTNNANTILTFLSNSLILNFCWRRNQIGVDQKKMQMYIWTN